jgi:hypothetical protein
MIRRATLVGSTRITETGRIKPLRVTIVRDELNVHLEEDSPGGNHAPACASRLKGPYRDVESSVVKSLEIPFELRNCEMLPFLGLRQQGAALKWPEGRGLAVQRCYCAISAYVFQDGFTIHLPDFPFFPVVAATCNRTIFDWLAGIAERSNGLRTVAAQSDAEWRDTKSKR